MQDIRLLNTVYEDVPAVELPKEGGGTARFDDTSDANATASDIVSGKTAYVNGSKLTGTHVLPTGSLSITSNDTYDVTDYASATVNVPNGILVTEETDSGGGIIKHITGTVISGTTNITQNGTYDVTNYASADVDVKDNAYEKMHAIYNSCFEGEVLPAIINFKKATYLGIRILRNSTGTKILVFPLASTISNYPLCDNTSVETMDLGTEFPNINSWCFSGNDLMNTLILRKESVVSIAATNALDATPFASNGSGGTLYVPQALISSYQSASNWSTILGYANNQIKSIESTHTDPTAPIDLTLYYADGTPIGA